MGVWEDREIRFDVQLTDLENRNGEFDVDTLDDIEDTKGNNGKYGRLRATNLRLVWHSANRRKTNLSIGYDCILSCTIKSANSRLRGKTQAMYVLTKFEKTRFEFVFTSVIDSPRLFTTIQAAVKAYETSTMFRDLKLRGAVIKDAKLLLLPDETILNRVTGAWNLSSDQGNLGTFFTTNIRVVWHANLAENFNVSIPYLQISSVRIRNSKFGKALVITTTIQSGSYVLGFRLGDEEELQQFHDELVRYHQLFSKKPIFGVEMVKEEVGKTLEEVKVERVEDDIEIVGDDEDANDAFALYYADGKSSDVDPVFDVGLGLAVEKLKSGVKLGDLWEVN